MAAATPIELAVSEVIAKTGKFSNEVTFVHDDGGDLSGVVVVVEMPSLHNDRLDITSRVLSYFDQHFPDIELCLRFGSHAIKKQQTWTRPELEIPAFLDSLVK